MHQGKMKPIILAAFMAMLVTACGGTGNKPAEQSAHETTPLHPRFDGDSAFALIVEQCDMGARVPGTVAHERCVKWLMTTLSPLADTVIEQQAPVTTFDGVHLTAHNVIAVFNPAATSRLLLLAHYDCRPRADADPDTSRHREPVMGANDAASGTAILVQLARTMSSQRPDRGIDLLFVDVEDWGNSGATDAEDTWALGTRYWATHPHVPGYKPAYAILLDMVGARGATFMREQYSEIYSSGIVDHVWRIASNERATCFINRIGGGVTDDHVPLLEAGITAIDIIDQRPGSEHGFFPEWHTTGDTPDVIDPTVLEQVGNTLLAVIYSR